MGCIVFFITAILSGFIYAILGGFMGQYIIDSKGITGTDTNYVFMPLFFVYVPILSFVTSIIVSVIVTRKSKKNE